MTVPSNFAFSQSALQVFIDCPRQFELRYILKQPWPAIEIEPAIEREHFLWLGQSLHQYIHRFILGIPPEILTPTIHDRDLQVLWHTFLSNNPLVDLPLKRYPEFILSAPFAGFRLIAKYDLIALEPGKRLTIIEWKTSFPKKDVAFIKKRIQTRLYLLLLVETGHVINHAPVCPDQVEMIYWFADKPQNMVRIPYSEKAYREDHEYMTQLIRNIASCKPGEFELTSNTKICAFCNYRSLCNRGKYAGNLKDLEEEPNREFEDTIQLDFDQIGAIPF